MSEIKYFYYNSKGERVRKKEYSIQDLAQIKIKFLEREFKFKLTPEEKEGMLTARSDISIDNQARDIFNRYLKSSA